MVELKPCPFCGGEAVIHRRRTGCRFYAASKKEIPKNGHFEKVITYADGHKVYAFWKTEYVPQCAETSCIGRVNKAYASEEDAGEAWNRRADNA